MWQQKGSISLVTKIVWHLTFAIFKVNQTLRQHKVGSSQTQQDFSQISVTRWRIQNIAQVNSVENN